MLRILTDDPKNTADDNRKNLSNVDNALRHLLYLTDVEKLFDAALGTYDFDLVLMVAEKSQKDPKEFLTFLNDLRRMPENYRKFKIDSHLGRKSKALRNLVACRREFREEFFDFVGKNFFYKQAIELIGPDADDFKVNFQIYSNF